MGTIATALVNTNALAKIILTALVGGTGVVIVFGVLLLTISRGKTAPRPTARYGLYALSGLCSMLIVTVAAFGVYAMTQKSSSSISKPRAAASGRTPPALPKESVSRARLG